MLSNLWAVEQPKDSANESLGIFDFLDTNFKYILTAPLGERHKRLYNWFENPDYVAVEILPRGSGKSTSAQLGICWLAKENKKKFVLYVSNTQAQAMSHLASIASLLETLGMEPLKGEFGNQKGWNKSILRTNTGFTIMAIGLDKEFRGVKVDTTRPDLIVFDDIDSHDDTEYTVEKKRDNIVKKILPMGGNDTSILFIQNLINPSGIASELIGNADYMFNRKVFIEKAIENLEYSPEEKRIGGIATWEGQPLDVCQRFVYERGINSFLEECQHEFPLQNGSFFNSANLTIIDSLPEMVRTVRGWDFAATQGAGDYTAGVLVGMCKQGNIYVIDCIRGQWGPDKVTEMVDSVFSNDKVIYKNYTMVVPQDPGAAGIQVANTYANKYNAKTVGQSGSKANKALAYAERFNTSLYILNSEWNGDFIREHNNFTTNNRHRHDDMVDASALAFNELVTNKRLFVASF